MNAFWMNAVQVENGIVVKRAGYQNDTRQALEAIRTLKKLYNGKEWKIRTWMEDFVGTKLLSFEMEAEREMQINGKVLVTVVKFSMVRG